MTARARRRRASPASSAIIHCFTNPQINSRTRLFLAGLAVIAAMGAMFGATMGAAMFTPRLTGAMLGSISGAVDFVAMAALIGGAETFLPRTWPGRALERAPFLAVFGIKAVAYSTVILAVVGGRFGPTSPPWRSAGN